MSARKAPLLLAGGLALALGLRVFSHKFHLADDPTCGIALRSSPSMARAQVLAPGDRVLLSDENSFPGEGLYRALAGWGWLALAAASLLSWASPLLPRRPRRG